MENWDRRETYYAGVCLGIERAACAIERDAFALERRNASDTDLTASHFYRSAARIARGVKCPGLCTTFWLGAEGEG